MSATLKPGDSLDISASDIAARALAMDVQEYQGVVLSSDIDRGGLRQQLVSLQPALPG